MCREGNGGEGAGEGEVTHRTEGEGLGKKTITNGVCILRCTAAALAADAAHVNTPRSLTELAHAVIFMN